MSPDAVTCERCWLEADVTLTVERIGFFQGRTYFPGPLRLCLKHATELARDLRVAEAHRV